MMTNAIEATRRGFWSFILLIVLLTALVLGVPAAATDGSYGAEADPAIVVAARDGDGHRVRRLLKEDPGQAAVVDRMDLTALDWAAMRGHWRIFVQLLQSGAPVDLVGFDGGTVMHKACHHDRADMIALQLGAGADPDRLDDKGECPADLAFTRPARVDLDPAAMDEFIGHYDLGSGFGFKVWLEDGALHLREFAPDEIYPIGPDAFYCVQEPWRVDFVRDASGTITAVDVAFLRQTVRGTRRDDPQYVGSEACRDCHMHGDRGGPYVTWLASRHAGAYWHLATDWALFLAKLRPHYHDLVDPLRDERCRLCHTTAGQDPEALLPSSFRIGEGIGC